MLDGASATGAAVPDEPGRLVVPLAEEVVDGVLERPGGRVVVFRRDEHEGVERPDLRCPRLRMRLRALVHRWRERLVEEREVERRDVHDLEGCIGPPGRDAMDPPSDRFGLTPWAGTSDDDSDVEHVHLGGHAARGMAAEDGTVLVRAAAGATRARSIEAKAARYAQARLSSS